MAVEGSSPEPELRLRGEEADGLTVEVVVEDTTSAGSDADAVSTPSDGETDA